MVDLDGLRPQALDDPWAEADGIQRLSSRIPGLGTTTGWIDLDSEPMTAAAAADVMLPILWLVRRTGIQLGSRNIKMLGDDLWERGCGW